MVGQFVDDVFVPSHGRLGAHAQQKPIHRPDVVNRRRVHQLFTQKCSLMKNRTLITFIVDNKRKNYGKEVAGGADCIG